MRWAIVLVSLVFASAAFLAQPVQAQPLGPSSLSGFVCIEAPWGECEEYLPGATVRVVGGGINGLLGSDEEVTSNEDGFYSVDELHDGNHQVTVSHAGFKTQTVSVSISGATSQDISLEGEMVDVAGTVEDTEGKPIAGAYVSMWGARGGADAKTAADGSFAVNVSAGWYYAQVQTQDHRYLEQRVLADGSDLLLAFEPLAGQEALLKGRVVDQHGDPVADAAVIVNQWEARRSDGSSTYGDFRNSTLTGTDGRYQIDVYGGDVSIEVRKAGYSAAHNWSYIEPEQTLTKDLKLMKYPAKTARLVGSVTDASGQELPFVRVSIELPQYGLHECSDRDHYGYAIAMAEPAYEDMAYSRSYGYYEPEPCAIQMDGGAFTGNVTPGYAILTVRFDRWAACDETHHADGSYERKCGPDYFTYTETISLEADADNVLSIVMEQRPGPDASISGYVLDGTTGRAIPNAWIDFQHQDAQGWGSASTDKDGSYKVRLRSGYQGVHVWAQGYLPWQGMVKIGAGDETPYDVILTPGESRYGGCCYYGRGASYDMAAGEGSSGSPAPPKSVGSSDGSDYEDMGGGLGPYDADARAKLLSQAPAKSNGVPTPLAFAVGGVAAALMLRRRRA